MRMIEIAALPNGAHRNQTFGSVLPAGWAVLPDEVETVNFPFGEAIVEEVTHYREKMVEQEATKTREVVSYDEEGNETVTTEEYTELEMVTVQEPYGVMTVTGWVPGVIPAPEPVPEVDPAPTIDERVSTLEDALAQTDETAIELYEAMAAQEEINTAQDDALIELYEMIGG